MVVYFKIEQLQANGAKLHNAYDVTNFLCIAMNVSHVAYSRAKLEVVRNFIEIKVGESDRQHLFNCKPQKKKNICFPFYSTYVFFCCT
jgi:hypothetical protein